LPIGKLKPSVAFCVIGKEKLKVVETNKIAIIDKTY